VQVDLSLPIGTSNIALYVQFWDGYGESLIDYNRSLTKVGAGLRIR
ncbi:MAG: phospholipase, partial [Alphaproteobacteria bacterium]